MRLRYLFSVLLTISALSGCAKQGPYGDHTAHWYQTHMLESEKEMAWCNKHPKQYNGSTCMKVRDGVFNFTMRMSR